MKAIITGNHVLIQNALATHCVGEENNKVINGRLYRKAYSRPLFINYKKGVCEPFNPEKVVDGVSYKDKLQFILEQLESGFITALQAKLDYTLVKQEYSMEYTSNADAAKIEKAWDKANA